MRSNYHQLCDSFFQIFEMTQVPMLHISRQDHGDKVKFLPRKPHSAHDSEPDTPRICVSPSLAGCLVAGVIPMYRDYTVIYVYQTKSPVVSTEGVFDQKATEEHWILQPAIFEKIGEFTLGEIPKVWRMKMEELFQNFPYTAEVEKKHLQLKQELEQWLQENPVLEPALVEADEFDDDEDIPTVPAPGNFHQHTSRKG